LAYGSVVASFCVEGVGTERVSKASASDVDARYEQLRSLTSF
jgi:hypothetical protein